MELYYLETEEDPVQSKSERNFITDSLLVLRKFISLSYFSFVL